jgi:hypothetical protein
MYFWNLLGGIYWIFRNCLRGKFLACFGVLLRGVFVFPDVVFGLWQNLN